MMPTLVIMAAGMANRYGSFKQIEKLGPQGQTRASCNYPLLKHLAGTLIERKAELGNTMNRKINEC